MPARDPDSESPADGGRKPSICRGTPAGEPGNSSPRSRGMPGSSTGEEQPPRMPRKRDEAPTENPNATAGNGSAGPPTFPGSTAVREAKRTMEPHAGGMGNTGWWDSDSPAAAQMGPKGEGRWPKGGFPERANRGPA